MAAPARKGISELRVQPQMSKADVKRLVKDKVQMEDKHFNFRVQGQTTLVFKPEGLLAALVCENSVEHLRLQNDAYDFYRSVARNVPTRNNALGVPNIHNKLRNGRL